MNVILIDEDLGLAWNETWEQNRIANILEGYKTHAFHLPTTMDENTEDGTKLSEPN